MNTFSARKDQKKFPHLFPNIQIQLIAIGERLVSTGQLSRRAPLLLHLRRSSTGWCCSGGCTPSAPGGVTTTARCTVATWIIQNKTLQSENCSSCIVPASTLAVSCAFCFWVICCSRNINSEQSAGLLGEKSKASHTRSFLSYQWSRRCLPSYV